MLGFMKRCCAVGGSRILDHMFAITEEAVRPAMTFFMSTNEQKIAVRRAHISMIGRRQQQLHHRAAHSGVDKAQYDTITNGCQTIWRQDTGSAFRIVADGRGSRFSSCHVVIVQRGL